MSIAEKLKTVADNERRVYEAGKQAEYDEFWDNYAVGSQYSCAGQGWTKTTFRPNRDFNVGAYGFCYHSWLREPYDLAEHLEELGVTMKVVDKTQSFRLAWFTRIPVCDMSTQSGLFDRIFLSGTNSPLVTIDKIILPPEGSVTEFFNMFGNCTKLANITFEGVIDKSISFSLSPLTAESMKSIITCLKDYSGTDDEFTYTVTFKSSAFEALEAEGATAEYDGVTCTWAELIDNKKWNLVKA